MKRWSTRILVPLLAAAFLAAEAGAAVKEWKTVQVRSSQNTSVRTFRVKPAMAVIPGSRVTYVRGEADYDLYRYGNYWYLAENGRWYRARSWRGPFVSIRSSAAPSPVRSVPSAYRSRGIAVGEPHPGSRPWIAREPPMAVIPETRVYYSLNEYDHDLYRLGDTWYVAGEGKWYRGDSWRGPFRPIRGDQIPAEIRNIPSGYRRNWVAPARSSRLNPEPG